MFFISSDEVEQFVHLHHPGGLLWGDKFGQRRAWAALTQLTD
jgi:hypothetical protein